MSHFLIIYALINNAPMPIVAGEFKSYQACRLARAALVYSVKKHPPTYDVIETSCVRIFQL